MAQVELVMPKMGESIMEATILKWVKSVGDSVELDDTILEIATDKVDSEVPSPVAGVLTKIFFEEDDTVEIGKVIALISTEGDSPEVSASPAVAERETGEPAPQEQPATKNVPQPTYEAVAVAETPGQLQAQGSDGRFYSPLVRSIAKEEGISQRELETVDGTGAQGRVTKKDILGYLQQRGNGNGAGRPAAPAAQPMATVPQQRTAPPASAPSQPTLVAGGQDEIIEMDRMRRLIADHMVDSKRTAAHVTSFIEVDVTDIVNWREAAKAEYQRKYGEKITYTPIFIEAVAKALRDFPMVNVSVDGNRIIRKQDLNIGMAAALPSGNLIVPVIKQADLLSLAGLTKAVNDLANRARNNKLKPEEVQGGTFTVTNVGTFGNVMGTPIINQPQVAILAVGAIRKKPAVVETEYGDLIAVRQLMFLSLSYDHRVVDGALGGSFLRRIGDYLEGFDAGRGI
jgi:2-oxoglutarate dehydrogenase E2 component (dihydrolipoamide succinyltransferase)